MCRSSSRHIHHPCLKFPHSSNFHVITCGRQKGSFAVHFRDRSGLDLRYCTVPPGTFWFKFDYHYRLQHELGTINMFYSPPNKFVTLHPYLPQRPPLNNGHFLLSPRWPLWRGSTVLMNLVSQDRTCAWVKVKKGREEENSTSLTLGTTRQDNW